MVGDTRDRKAAQQGRPMMVSEPRTQARTPAGRAKGLNQPKPDQPPSRSVLYSLFASGAGDYREEKENSTLSFDLAIVCGQRQYCTFTRLPGHRQSTGSRQRPQMVGICADTPSRPAPASPAPPRAAAIDVLRTASGEAIDGTQLTRCTCSLPSQAGSFPWHSHTAHGCAQ